MSDSPAHPHSRISISRKVVLGVVFALVMLALIALTGFFATRRFQNNANNIANTREVLEMSERVQRHLAEMESGIRGFLLSGDEKYLGPYKHGYSFILQDVQALQEATAGSTEQQAQLGRLLYRLAQLVKVYGKAIEARNEGGSEAASTFFLNPEMNLETDSIREAIQDEMTDFDQLERRKLLSLQDANEEIGRVTTSLIAGGTSLTYIALLVACLVILRDIAARNAVEEALELERNLLQSVIDTIPDQIFVKDLEGHYLRDNVAHRRQIRAESQEAVIGKRAGDFFPKELAEEKAADDKKVFETRKPILNKEEKGVGPDGRPLWFEKTKVPLLGPDGRLLGLVGVSSDITVRKMNEEKLRHIAVQLQKSNEELQNFASVASHDLQEPLRKIQAFGDRLRMRYSEALGEQGSDFLHRMLDAAQRMQVLIQDLLKLSRVATRAQPFEKVSLKEVLQGVLSDLEVKIANTQATIHVGDLPTIDADPTQLRQLFQNLIANALKFQKPGVKPEIRISHRILENNPPELSEVPRGALLCELTLQDNGIGFGQKFAEQIFVVFQRLHTRTEYEGTGIGLAVCRKITDRHRGKISAKSSPGEGATFVITLPVHQTVTPRP